MKVAVVIGKFLFEPDKAVSVQIRLCTRDRAKTEIRYTGRQALHSSAEFRLIRLPVVSKRKERDNDPALF